MDSYNIPKKNSDLLNPHISVDCVIFGFNSKDLHVLLIDRLKTNEQLANTEAEHALPGDLIYNNESLDTAALRVLKELTGLENIYLSQFAVFGDPNRVLKERDQKWLKSIRSQPNARVVSIGYFAMVNMNNYHPIASSFATNAEWINVRDIGELPFDHNMIFNEALEKLKEMLKCKPIGYNLLPEKFTLAQLQQLYEVILNKELDKRNFRRKILSMGMLDKLKEKQQNVSHKPATYYSFDLDKYNILMKKGFDRSVF